MFEALIASIGGKFIDGFFTSALQAFTAYQNKQITEAQLKEQLMQSMLQSSRDIEVAAYDAMTKTYASFMQAMDNDKSLIMKRVWAATAISQLVVLLWHQVGIPAFVIAAHAAGYPHFQYPSSGTTVQWAYALLGGLLGMAPLVLRSGPGAGTYLERAKAVIGK